MWILMIVLQVREFSDKFILVLSSTEFYEIIVELNNNNFFSLKYVELCAWKSAFAGSSSSFL